MKNEVLKKEKLAFGTKEWASSNVNFIKGCVHDCKYCFAKGIGVRVKRCTAESWKIEKVQEYRLNKNFRKRKGTIMFPSSHDITPKNADLAIGVLEKLLKARNDVLIVSKPHLEVIQKLCNHFPDYKKQILFRFTIGSIDEETLKFWEPYAQRFEERMKALKFAFYAEFKTSVSCEPALGGNTLELVQKLTPFVTDSIWIGLANRLKANLKLNGHGDAETWKKADALKKLQCKKWLYELAEMLADNPKVRWKDSCKKILQMDRPTAKGLDV